jgi:hypothetical protein
VKWFTIAFLGETQFGGAFLRLALPVALCFAVSFSAQADVPATGTNRFLFIIDTSAGMKTIEEPLREAVFDLIYSGVRGQMTNGDSYGIWLADAQNDTSVGVEAWKQKFAVELAAKAALRVKDHGFKGKCALDVALADAARVAESVNDVTVVIVSNGETPFRGTPFDDAINAQITKLLPEMQKAKLPINAVLAARDGVFVAWALNSPDFLINSPTLPPRAVKAASGLAQTTPPAPPATMKPIVTPKPKPRIAANPIVITRETVDREKQALRAMASTDPASPVGTTNPAQPAVTNSTIVTSKPTNAPVVTSPVPATALRSAATDAVAQTLSESPQPTTQTNAETTERSGLVATSVRNVAAVIPLTTIAPETPAASPAASSRTFLYIGLGGAAALVLLVTIALIRRARAMEPSLITQLERMRR